MAMELNQETSTDRPIPPTESTRERERPSVRDSLRQSFADARRDEEILDRDREARAPRDEEVTEEPVEEEVTETAEGETEAEASSETEAESEQPTERKETKPATSTTTAAPTSWTREAKAEWSKLPERIKREVLKREKDVEKGVEALKNQYKEIDEAIAPYAPVIRQFQKTPGQAVSQLFAWFDALAKNPDQAFPALAKSYNYDMRRLAQAAGYRLIPMQGQNEQVQQVQNGQQRVQGAESGQQPAGPVAPEVQAYINKLEQRLNGFEQQVGQRLSAHDQYVQQQNQYYQEQNAARTQEMLENWAKDKPYFQDVRMMMGHLLTPDPNTGQAAIPLRDGKVDLDAAYEAAVYALPDVRSLVLADQQAKVDAARKAKLLADKKAQQEQAEKAKRTATSISTSAPGAEVSRKESAPKGMSVRDSLKAAIRDLSDR